MTLETITVGKVTMKANTIPVTVLFDQVFLTYKDRYTVIEVDGAYIVTYETGIDPEPSNRQYKAFLTQRDALDFLTIFGIDVEGKDEN